MDLLSPLNFHLVFLSVSVINMLMLGHAIKMFINQVISIDLTFSFSCLGCTFG